MRVCRYSEYIENCVSLIGRTVAISSLFVMTVFVFAFLVKMCIYLYIKFINLFTHCLFCHSSFDCFTIND